MLLHINVSLLLSLLLVLTEFKNGINLLSKQKFNLLEKGRFGIIDYLSLYFYNICYMFHLPSQLENFEIKDQYLLYFLPSDFPLQSILSIQEVLFVYDLYISVSIISAISFQSFLPSSKSS